MLDNPLFHSILLQTIPGLLSSGIVVLFLQQWLQARFKRFDSRLSREGVFNLQKYQELISSFKIIWLGLVQIEDLIKQRIPQFSGTPISTDSPVLLPSPIAWRDEILKIYSSFRGEMILLPEPLSSDIEQLFERLAEDFNNFMNFFVELVKAGKRTSTPEQTAEANRRLNKMQRDYSEGLKLLRVEFDNSARNVIFKDLELDAKNIKEEARIAPRLQFVSGKGSLLILNAGLGPAIIGRTTIVLDGKTVTTRMDASDWVSVLTTLNYLDKTTELSFDLMCPNTMISAKEKKRVLCVSSENVPDAFKERVSRDAQRLKLTIEYTSILGKRYKANWDVTKI